MKKRKQKNNGNTTTTKNRSPSKAGAGGPTPKQTGEHAPRHTAARPQTTLSAPRPRRATRLCDCIGEARGAEGQGQKNKKTQI